MKHVLSEGVDIAYEEFGTGEPVLFIHGALVADALRPLAAHPRLTERYRCITFHRRGYGESGRGPGRSSLAEQAADSRALLHALGVRRAHVLGHSLGALIALQFALDAPEMVHSLALLETALVAGESAQGYRDSLERAAQRYRDGEGLAVVDEMMRARWPGYSREALDRVLPGASGVAAKSAATTFEVDPLWAEMQYRNEDAQKVMQPVLVVLGSASVALNPRFGETQRTLLAWLPNAEGVTIDAATHFFHLESPSIADELAATLAAFWARHPIT